MGAAFWSPAPAAVFSDHEQPAFTRRFASGCHHAAVAVDEARGRLVAIFGTAERQIIAIEFDARADAGIGERVEIMGRPAKRS